MLDRLVVLGGSSVHAPELFPALHARALPAGEVCLVGRVPERTEATCRFSRRFCDELGYRTRLTWTTDVRKGLRGATHVINQVRVGGAAAWFGIQHMLKAFGFVGHAVTTVGALTNLRPVMELARAVVEVCPRAWLVEFANPCGVHAEAFARHLPDLRVVTACNRPLRERKTIGALLGETIDPTVPGRVELQWLGLNHCAFVSNITRDGREVTAEALARNEVAEKPRWPAEPARRLGGLFAVEAERLFQAPKATPADAAVLAGTYSAAEADAEEAALRRLFADEGLRPSEVFRRHASSGNYESAIVPVLEGLSGAREVRYYCSQPLPPVCPGFPGRTIECAVTIARDQVTPLPVRPIPDEVLSRFAIARRYEELLIEATLNRKRELLMEALATHPSCFDRSQAHQAAEAVWTAFGHEG